MRRPAVPPLAALALLAFAPLLYACEPEGAVDLLVTLRTDLEPGVDFVLARVELIEEPSRGQTEGAFFGDAIYFEPGLRFESLSGLAPSPQRRLRLSLFDLSGEVVASREALVDNRLSLAVELFITRDCAGVVCDDPIAQTCIAGSCGSPGCLTGLEPECPEAECATEADCPALSGCATRLCLNGACVYAADDSLCAPEEYCEVEAGCTPRPDAPPPTAPSPPRVLLPWTGAATGSALAPDAVPLPPRRPRFVWEAAAGAERYELVIDDSCSIETYLSCDFPSPEISEEVTGLEFRPATPLAVSTAPPVGTRYYYRIRSCDAEGCGDFGRPRYLDVGRQRNDYNGDGYAEIYSGAPGEPDGAPASGILGIFPGTAEGTAIGPNYRSSSAQAEQGFGLGVAALGDLDADGYADSAVSAPLRDQGALDAGVTHVFFGQETLFGVSYPDSTITLPVAVADGLLGRSVAGAGDVDADGYADLLVGAMRGSPGATAGTAILYRGGADGISSVPGRRIELLPPAGLGEPSFGGVVAGGGDLNGDGFLDVAVASPEGGAAGAGLVSVYLGGQEGISTSPDAVLQNPADEPGSLFGAALSMAGDIDGDGYADLAVGAPDRTAGAAEVGVVYLYLGSAEGLPSSPSATISCPVPAGGAHFGWSLLLVDFDEDGSSELLVGAPGMPLPLAGQGAVYLYQGSPGGLGASPASTLGYESEAGAGFGSTLAAPGDVNGDGRAEIAIGAPGSDYFSGTLRVDHGRLHLLVGGSSLASPEHYFVALILSSGARLGSSLASLEPPRMLRPRHAWRGSAAPPAESG